MGLYILQFSLFLAVFYIVYLVFLKKETFFQYNRWYVLITPCLALILPFIALDFLRPETAVGQAFVNLPPVLLGDFSGATGDGQLAQQVSASPSIGSWILQHAWLFLYGIGFTVALFFLLKKIVQFNRFKKTGKLKEDRGVSYHEVKNSRMACTFFNQIFIGDEITSEQRSYILRHELVHVSQYHSLDLLFFEVLKILFWFHPAIYAYQKQLSSLHEFIADEEVTRHASKTNYYQSLLNVAFGTHQISFINQFFNHSLIKKRILMLQKSKSSTRAKLKYLIVLPLIALMLTYVSCSDEEEVVETQTSEIPAPPPPPPPYSEDYPKEIKLEVNNVDNLTSQESQKVKSLQKDLIDDKIPSRIVLNDGNKTSIIEYLNFDSKDIISTESILPNETENYGVIEVEDLDNLTADENRKFRELSRKIIQDDVMHKLVITDGKYKRVIDFEKSSSNKIDGIPFTAIELVPAYPGCDQSLSNDEIKKCTSDKIKDFVNANFNTKSVEDFAQDGVNRVYVRFTIAKDGNVKDVQARAPSPELKKEAERVVNSLPKMQPGIQDGKAVGVLYSLPIIFQIN